MANQSYRRPGFVLGRGAGAASSEQVRDLQRDLRTLGYLDRGIDGLFGARTEAALKALTYDLLHNGGDGADGQAPIAVRDYNRGRVAAVTGRCDEAVASCIGDLLDEPAYGRVPSAADAAGVNADLRKRLGDLRSGIAPVPYLLAILEQESGGRHYREPQGGDEDCFVVVGLDRNDSANPAAVTSRGYGIGQHTFFHHPPSRQEIAERVERPAGNLLSALHHLREKFDRFLLGPAPGTQADDRLAEIGDQALRLCRYDRDDPRYLRDCTACLRWADRHDIEEGTPLFAGASASYVPTRYYASADYRGVPRRSRIGCDWPYAVRRYNGAGVNSYHYQARILLRLLAAG